MGADWPDCIVTVFDLDAVKSQASKPGVGSSLMRRLHSVVRTAMAKGELPSVSRAYTWNDSVLLLAYVEAGVHLYEPVLRDADRLKRAIDAVGPSYAVAVKGQAFPAPIPAPKGGPAPDTRVTHIEASSYAMANCFIIAQVIGKKLLKPWYVDSRIATHIRTTQAHMRRRVTLLPRERRFVNAYDGYLWPPRLSRTAS